MQGQMKYTRVAATRASRIDYVAGLPVTSLGLNCFWSDSLNVGLDLAGCNIHALEYGWMGYSLPPTHPRLALESCVEVKVAVWRWLRLRLASPAFSGSPACSDDF